MECVLSIVQLSEADLLSVYVQSSSCGGTEYLSHCIMSVQYNGGRCGEGVQIPGDAQYTGGYH